MRKSKFTESQILAILGEGEALALQRLLARRFGAIPPAVTAQIGTASKVQIEAWFDAAIA